MDQLKSNLENAGIHINQISVEVGGFNNQFEKKFSDGKNGNGGKGNQGNSSSGDTQEEVAPGKVKNQRPVSYYLGRSINLVV